MFVSQALCEATKQDARAAQTDQCNAYAFKRGAPFSYTDQTGWCYLLQNAGACKLEDFGVELYTRYYFEQTPTQFRKPVCLSAQAD